MIAEPITASGIIPAPITIPAAIAQNRYTISIGSLIAARNRTIESAPTIPRESTTLDVTAMMISVVTRASPTSVSENPLEYITPLNVFLYTINTNSPITSANNIPISVSTAENSVIFSRKPDLKMSLNVINYVLLFQFRRYPSSTSAVFQFRRRPSTASALLIPTQIFCMPHIWKTPPAASHRSEAFPVPPPAKKHHT